MPVELKQTAVRQSLVRPNHLFGAEREPALMSLFLSGMLIFIGMTFYTIVLGVFLWVVAISLLRRMAKTHPQMLRVYQRAIKYHVYYPAREHLPLPKPWSVLRK